MEKGIKIILSILFFICLADMPYGYYMFVRTVAMIGFAILAYMAFQEDKGIIGILFIGLVILFQPIFKIPLGRTLWNIVDVIVGLWLLISSFTKKEEEL